MSWKIISLVRFYCSINLNMRITCCGASCSEMSHWTLISTGQLFSLLISRINDRATLSAVIVEHALDDRVWSATEYDKEHAGSLEDDGGEPQELLLWSSKSNSSASSVVEEQYEDVNELVVWSVDVAKNSEKKIN